MKLTKIAIALAAVLAMSSLTASAASAAEYKSSAASVNLSGTQTNPHEFTIDGQNVKCNSATFARNGLSTPAKEVQMVTATYKECTAFGIEEKNATVNVNMGTCTYNFDPPNPLLSANIDIACTSNANINGNVANTGDARIYASILGKECEVHIESQNNKGTLNFENNKPEAGDVLVRAAINPANNGGVNALTAEKTKDNGLCPLSGTGVVNKASYEFDTGFTGNGEITIEVG